MPDPMFDKQKRRRAGRVEGDFIYFTVLHNIISMILFFSTANVLGLFERRSEKVIDFFTFDFISLVAVVFVLSVMFGLFSRLLAYLIMYQIYIRWRKTEMKKIGELNRGINKMSLAYFISALIGSIFFSIGVVIIIHSVVFGNSETVISLLISYLVMKGIIFFGVRLFSNFSL